MVLIISQDFSSSGADTGCISRELMILFLAWFLASLTDSFDELPILSVARQFVISFLA